MQDHDQLVQRSQNVLQDVNRFGPAIPRSHARQQEGSVARWKEELQDTAQAELWLTASSPPLRVASGNSLARIFQFTVQNTMAALFSLPNSEHHIL